MDPVAVGNVDQCPSGYEITIRGFREHTGMDALEWARRAEDLGVGEIVVNHRERKFGRSKYGLTRIIKGLLELQLRHPNLRRE